MCHLVEFDVTHLLPELPAPWSDEDDVGEGPLPDGVTGSLSQKSSGYLFLTLILLNLSDRESGVFV